MREPKNQMLGTMEPPLMQLSVNVFVKSCFIWHENAYLFCFYAEKQEQNPLHQDEQNVNFIAVGSWCHVHW